MKGDNNSKFRSLRAEIIDLKDYMDLKFHEQAQRIDRICHEVVEEIYGKAQIMSGLILSKNELRR